MTLSTRTVSRTEDCAGVVYVLCADRCANHRLSTMVGGVDEQLLAQELPPDDHLAVVIRSDQMKCCLAEINASRCDMDVTILIGLLDHPTRVIGRRTIS